MPSPEITDLMRVLFIARYRDPTMHRKVEHMVQQRDLLIRHIFPRVWQDDLLRVDQKLPDMLRLQRQSIEMIGSPVDPHRSFYSSLTLGIPSFRPHIIHAEEEPDSLAALQIVLYRRIFAPRAKLFLHTWQNLDRPLSWAVASVLRVTLAAADAIFCANQEAIALLRRRQYNRPKPFVPAIGVDTGIFHPRMPRSADGPFVIGFVGRLVAEKGIDSLIDAMTVLRRGSLPRPLRLRLIGGGPLEASLRAQVQNAGLAENTEFLPPVPLAQIAQQMAELDVLVLPSRTTTVWKEQLGRVLVEAMAIGVPVVGSDSGSIPEVISDAGLIFPEGDAPALAEQLRQLLHNPALAEELSRRGIERAQTEYSQQVLAGRTVEFYMEMSDKSA